MTTIVSRAGQFAGADRMVIAGSDGVKIPCGGSGLRKHAPPQALGKARLKSGTRRVYPALDNIQAVRGFGRRPSYSALVRAH